METTIPFTVGALALLLIFMFYAVKFLGWGRKWNKMQKFITQQRKEKRRGSFQMLTTGTEIIIVAEDEHHKMTDDTIRLRWEEKIL